MRTLTSFFAALVLFIGSEALLAYYGYVKIYLVFFVPVFVSSSFLAFVPLLFFLFPVLLSLRSERDSFPYERPMYGNQETAQPNKSGETKVAGVVMIGPIPIVFGKGISGRTLIILAAIMLILIIVWFVFAK